MKTRVIWVLGLFILDVFFFEKLADWEVFYPLYKWTSLHIRIDLPYRSVGEHGTKRPKNAGYMRIGYWFQQEWELCLSHTGIITMCNYSNLYICLWLVARDILFNMGLEFKWNTWDMRYHVSPRLDGRIEFPSQHFQQLHLQFKARVESSNL